MANAANPLTVINELHDQYSRDYRRVERWRDYGLSGEFPSDLVEDDAFREELGSTEGREMMEQCVRVYRIQIRQLMSCEPAGDYSTSELIQLCQQAIGVLNALSKLVSSLVIRQREANGSSNLVVPSLVFP